MTKLILSLALPVWMAATLQKQDQPKPKPDSVSIEQVAVDPKSNVPIYGCKDDGYTLWSGEQELVWKVDHREFSVQWHVAQEQHLKFLHPRWTYQCWINGKSPLDAQ